MNDFLFIKVSKAAHKISENFESLSLWNFVSKSQVIFEITFLTIFRHKINIVGRLIDIIKRNNVFMLDLFHDFDLRLNSFKVIGVGEKFLIDDFDCAD